MTAFLIPLAAAALIVAVCTGILVRADRRRMASITEGRPAEPHP